MLVKSFAFLAVVAVVAANSLAGVDPNSLQCDPSGQTFLLLPHFDDCGKFYMCTHGREVEFSCAGGLIFDFVLQTCNWPRATECVLRDREVESDEGSGEDIGVEGSGDEASGDEGSGDESWANEIQPFEAYALNNAVFKQSEKSQFSTVLNCLKFDSAAKQVAYKGDCQRYWKCVDGKPQTAYCTDGLFFNAQTQQCDFEANVRCDDQFDEELKGEFIVVK